MKHTAYILAIISTVLLSWTLIALIWMIPMTIAIKNSQGDGKRHTALGVCSIFFLGFLGIPIGILVLISEE